jgi:predicted ATPase/DNA-binding winged helix-turn-helix (wHTH) protein
LHRADEQQIVGVVAEPVMAAEQIGSSSAGRILFGPFELNVAERSLKKADDVIPLGGRAFDILLALLDRPGEIVSKGDLIAKVWPDVTVEEGSLRVHLSALRKALGEGQFGNKYIANVQGRGYCFAAPVRREAAEPDKADTFSKSSNLPPTLGRMIGRDDAVLEIRARFRTERLITVLGAGGIGKTTGALAAGHAALADFAAAVFFVDLSAVRDREQVVGAIASAIGIDLQFADTENALFSYLRFRKALIILDSCEHLIGKTSEVIDCIFRRASGIYLLATSREALQIAGEGVLRLHPRDYPPEQPRPTAVQVLSYPAVQLFVERVSARGGEFSLSDEEAPIVAEICRKLDGIALAIELAAGRAAVFGVKDTAARQGCRLDLLKFGRRTANPRHQTLRAALDWSHDHLSEVERIVLRRVAIFIGHFTLEAALAAAEEEGIGKSDVADAMRNLVDKSLIGARVDSRGTFYRLLDTTRSYALEKLATSGEHDSIAARHASFATALLEAGSVDLVDLRASKPMTDTVRDYLGNVRAALEWSFGSNGNDRAAIRLTAAASQLFLAMSLLLECRNWMEKAIDRMAPDCDPRHQAEVYASLALSLMFTDGNSEKVHDAFRSALTFAERCEDGSQQLRLLSGLSMYFHRIIDTVGALELALRSETVARKTGSPEDAALADSMLGAAYYIRGDHLRAQEHLGRALHGAPRHRQFNAVQYLFDLRTLSLICLTRSHWFTGDLDRAASYAEMTIEETERSHHPIALCRALKLTMPFYFWIDDLQQVEQNLSRLDFTAEKYSLAPFRAVALGLKGQLSIRVGRTMDGIRHLRDGLEKLRGLRYEMLRADFISELAVSLARRNERMEALTLVDESIAAQFKVNRPLHLPALFLAKGLVFMSGDVSESRSAQPCFEQAMTQARQQSAVSFELRAGLEMARMWIGRGEHQRVGDLIRPIYSRFSDGFATPDLISAKTMLEPADLGNDG